MDGVLIIALFVGWMLDALWGDPECVPHPVVYFGKLISRGEALLNKGTHRMLKGALMAVTLIAGTYLFFYVLLQINTSILKVVFISFESFFFHLIPRQYTSVLNLNCIFLLTILYDMSQ